MLNLFLVQYHSFRNRLLSLSFRGEAKAALFLLINVSFIIFIFLIAYRLLSFINTVELIGPLLVNKIAALVFLGSFCMVVFSGIITSFGTIYLSKDLDWLMATPLSVRKIFAFKSIATSFYASWMVCAALLPFLTALGMAKGAGGLYYVWSFILLIPFFTIAGLLGVMFALALMRFFPSRNTRDIVMFLGIFALSGAYILFRLMEPEKLIRPEGMEAVSQYLSFLDRPVAGYLPSWWITAAVFGLISGNAASVLAYSGLLIGVCGVIAAGLIWVSWWVYYHGWAEGQVLRGRPKKRKHGFSQNSAFYSIFLKDITIFTRDAGQWSQFMILGSIVVVYLFSLYRLPLDTFYLQNLISFVNIGLISFVLAAVALRLVFPLVSIEGKSLWLAFTSPAGRENIYFEKLLFGGLPVLALAAVLTAASNLILGTDPPVFYMTCAAAVIISLGLISLAMCLGSMYPRFETDNIAEIETSPGGIFFIVSSLFYIVLNMSLWAVPVHEHYASKFGIAHHKGEYTILISSVLAFLNLSVIVFSLLTGLKYFKSIEK